MGIQQPGRIYSPFKAVEINAAICSGCNHCVEICPMDVFVANPSKGEPPLVFYPEECWFCGCCVEQCPLKKKKAIRLVIPLPMRVSVLKGNED